MKNKKLLYILIPLTLAIWGAVAYSIISHLKPDHSLEIDYQTEIKKDIDTVRTTYTLLADYRDPFRSGNETKPAKINKPTIKTQTNIVNRTSMVYWPDIEYKGFITNHSKKVALIRMNGRNFLMDEEQVENNIRLIQMFPDSVKLEFSGEFKTIKKKVQ